MKYYNVELSQTAAGKLKQILYDLKIEFEVSAAGPCYHFEIFTDAAGAAVINKFLEVI